MTEIWRPAPGFEELYSVSSLGRVRRDAGGHGAVIGRILRSSIRKDGYEDVVLSRKAKPKTILVHALVSRAFLSPAPNGQEPNHEDGNKANNRADNLTWTTKAGNLQHARDHGLLHPRKGEAHPNVKLTDQQVQSIRNAPGSNRALAAIYGVHHSQIGKIRTGQARKV